jgi:5'-deoxynucleotidase YfbR-like HD superfamily hydrolase
MPMPDVLSELGHMRLLRAGGCVQRYHTARTLRVQTVADHSWGVAALVAKVYPAAGPTLFRAALFHDVSETFTGDIPATAKWKHPELRAAENAASTHYNTMLGIEHELSGFEYSILKWCDMMELLLWCAEEARMGNTFIVDILRNATEYILTIAPPTDGASKLLSEFIVYIKPLLNLENDWYA